MSAEPDALARYAHIEVHVTHIGEPSPERIVEALESVCRKDREKQEERPATYAAGLFFGERMIELHEGDCLEVMPTLPAASVDLICADPPYGTTACKWDSVIPFAPMWEAIKRVIKPNGAVVLFGSQPFTSALVMSNPAWFKYCWVWIKSNSSGWQHGKNRPMSMHEDIAVFSPAPMGHESLLGDRRMLYYPQGARQSIERSVQPGKHGRILGERPNQVGKKYNTVANLPTTVLKVPNLYGAAAIHPTQKPVALLAYLIRTYTNPGDTVLDFCMGSGSTGAACIEEGRRFIGIEQDSEYFKVASERLERERTKPRTMRMELDPA